MRKTVAGPVKARRGQTVHFHVSLPKNERHAFCLIFSAVGDSEPSPHVELEKLHLLTKGRPVMVNPKTMRLSLERPQASTSFVADEDSRFYIMQEVDTKDDRPVKGRIVVHGSLKQKIASAFRWICGTR
jgi:hypothetical protein